MTKFMIIIDKNYINRIIPQKLTICLSLEETQLLDHAKTTCHLGKYRDFFLSRLLNQSLFLTTLQGEP